MFEFNFFFLLIKKNILFVELCCAYSFFFCVWKLYLIKCYSCCFFFSFWKLCRIITVHMGGYIYILYGFNTQPSSMQMLFLSLKWLLRATVQKWSRTRDSQRKWINLFFFSLISMVICTNETTCWGYFWIKSKIIDLNVILNAFKDNNYLFWIYDYLSFLMIDYL